MRTSSHPFLSYTAFIYPHIQHIITLCFILSYRPLLYPNLHCFIMFILSYLILFYLYLALEPLLRAWTKPGDLVLDVFAGSTERQFVCAIGAQC